MERHHSFEADDARVVPASPATEFSEGDQVLIHGLTSNESYNGQTARVVSFKETTSCWIVHIEDKCSIAVKRANLTPLVCLDEAHVKGAKRPRSDEDSKQDMPPRKKRRLGNPEIPKENIIEIDADADAKMADPINIQLSNHFRQVVSSQLKAVTPKRSKTIIQSGVVTSLYVGNGGSSVDDIIVKAAVERVRKAKYFGLVYPEVEMGEKEVGVVALANRHLAEEDRHLESDYGAGNSLEDTDMYFASTNESTEYIQKLWTPHVQPTGAAIQVFPERFTAVFDDMTTDIAMSAMGFFSFASHLTKKLCPRSNNALYRKYKFHECENVAYYLDVAENAPFEVREPFKNYGAVAMYSAAREIVGIYVSYLDNVVKPGDRDWEHAKYVFKTSAVIQVTTKDHLVELHLIFGNEIVTASREILPVDHPVGRLLTPHMFNVAQANFKSPVLLGYNGLFHLAFAFTYDAVYRQNTFFRTSFEFKTFPQLLNENGMDQEDPKNFGPMDGLRLYETIRHYVDEYMRIYYPNESDLRRDADVNKFFNRVAMGMRLSWNLGFDVFVDLISQFIFSVSGMHENVGSVLGITRKDDQVGTRIQPGQTRQDIQALIHTSTVAVATTPHSEPKLIDDYSRVLENRADVREVYSNFRERLRKLEHDIDECNKQRPVGHDYLNFSPKVCTATVSV